jgi:hypothetical protein
MSLNMFVYHQISWIGSIVVNSSPGLMLSKHFHVFLKENPFWWVCGRKMKQEL